jgi:hypothetical protein
LTWITSWPRCPLILNLMSVGSAKLALATTGATIPDDGVKTAATATAENAATIAANANGRPLPTAAIFFTAQSARENPTACLRTSKRWLEFKFLMIFLHIFIERNFPLY